MNLYIAGKRPIAKGDSFNRTGRPMTYRWFRKGQFILLAFLAACSQPEDRPFAKKCKGVSCPATDDSSPAASLPSSSDPTKKPIDTVDQLETELDPATTQAAKLWRLSPKQLSNTYSAVLGKSVSLESKFDLGSRPMDGFGLDADELFLDSVYTSSLANAVNELVKASLGDIKKTNACLNNASPDQACVQSFVRQFASSAFRRPLSNAEIDQYSSLYNTIKTDSPSDDAVAVVAEAILRSPFAQFRFELGQSVAGSPGVNQLTPFELASQISYALTDSPPDRELLAAAEKGDLVQKEVLEQHTTRLMKSEKFEAAFAEFMTRWTGTKWLATMSKSKASFPDYGEAVVKAMLEEEKQFAIDFLRRDGTFKDLLTQTETTITPPLASVYGVPAFSGTKKIVSKKEHRSGVLTLPGVVAANSHSDQTGPVGRGVFLMRKLMCFAPPPPPPDIPSEVANVDPNLTFRERFAMHIANPTCAGCHVKLDPVGFSMEHYDPIGRYRTTDSGKPVDSKGEFTLGGNVTVAFAHAPEMLGILADNKEIQQCFVKQMMHYALGRPMTAFDKDFVKATHTQFVSSGLNIKKLLVSIYTSNNFRYRKEK